jgi:hypothetical protein
MRILISVCLLLGLTVGGALAQCWSSSGVGATSSASADPGKAGCPVASAQATVSDSTDDVAQADPAPQVVKVSATAAADSGCPARPGCAGPGCTPGVAKGNAKTSDNEVADAESDEAAAGEQVEAETEAAPTANAGG